MTTTKSPVVQRERVRLFTALWPTPSLRARLADERDAWRWPPGAKAVVDASLHLTLHFIGAFARDRMAALENALAAVPIAPMQLQAHRRAVWRGGIAVLLFDADAPVATLHAAIGGALATLDVALDPRPFAPHVTLARRARGADPPALPATLAWHADRFALVESLGGTAGYRVVRSFGAAP